MPDCDVPNIKHGIVPRPCTDAVSDRNWDETISAIEKLRTGMLSLQNCFVAPALDAIGVFPFKLTAALALGGTAAAVLRSRSGGAWVDGAAIVVKDLWNCGGKFWGRIDDIGFAWKDPGTDEYVVTELQTIARSIRYTVTIAAAAPTYTVTVNDFWNGCDPGATVTVYDAQGIYLAWHCKGCTGHAEYNELNGRYEIRDAQLAYKFYKMELDASGTCVDPLEPGIIPAETTGGILQSYPQSHYSASPYDGSDVAITAGIVLKNPYQHMCPGNQIVLAMAYRDGDELSFVIVDVIKFLRATVPPSGVLSWGDCTLTANTIQSAVETCDEPTEETVPIPFITADVPDTFEIIHGTSPDSCKIVAHTRQYCMIDKEADGADIDVAVMSEREVLIDWYLDYVAAVPPLTEYYAIKTSTEKLWVPCYNSGTEVDIHHLLRRDIIDDFEPVQDSSPETCEIVAHTKQTWVFDLPDPPVAGDDIDVLSMTKREVLIDLYTTSTDLMMDTEYHWILCYDPIAEQSVVGIDPCE